MKQQVTQAQYNQIFKRCYNSGRFQHVEDIIMYLRKKFEIKGDGQ